MSTRIPRIIKRVDQLRVLLQVERERSMALERQLLFAELTKAYDLGPDDMIDTDTWQIKPRNESEPDPEVAEQGD